MARSTINRYAPGLSSYDEEDEFQPRYGGKSRSKPLSRAGATFKDELENLRWDGPSQRRYGREAIDSGRDLKFASGKMGHRQLSKQRDSIDRIEAGSSEDSATSEFDNASDDDDTRIRSRHTFKGAKQPKTKQANLSRNLHARFRDDGREQDRGDIKQSDGNGSILRDGAELVQSSANLLGKMNELLCSFTNLTNNSSRRV